MTIPPSQTVPEGGAEKRQAELICGAASGDQHALAELYDATSRTVYGLLLRILVDASAAEEVLLDVYEQVWRQASQYSRERGSPLAWLTTIARSRAIDRLRRGRREQQNTEPLDGIVATARAGGIEMSAGDFNCSLPGSVHEEIATTGGALFLIVGPERYEVVEARA